MIDPWHPPRTAPTHHPVGAAEVEKGIPSRAWIIKESFVGQRLSRVFRTTRSIGSAGIFVWRSDCPVVVMVLRSGISVACPDFRWA